MTDTNSIDSAANNHQIEDFTTFGGDDDLPQEPALEGYIGALSDIKIDPEGCC